MIAKDMDGFFKSLDANIGHNVSAIKVEKQTAAAGGAKTGAGGI